PDHPRGRHKARVFRSALGIGSGDWRYLHDQLLAAVVGAPVRAKRITPFGVLYDVVVLIDGLNGSTYPVATVWLVERDGARVWSRPGWTSHDRLRQSDLMATRPHTELDVVELLAESGRWPAGAVGTVVEASDAAALIEIADDRGHAIDFVSVPHDALRSLDADATRAAS
ncbi:MAG: hypothetical protein QOH83_956, partial [Solirubrobacteraceae bacterium]|nr:hypothetical protein [Solirubrobacteraceae bacterium]